MRLIGVVLGKELMDHMRDRRSVLTALIFPVLGPVMFAGMFTILAGWMREDRPLQLSVVGTANAPNLIAFLERAGAQLTPAPADYEQQVQDGDLDVVLVIPKAYGDDFEAGRSAKLDLVVDNSRNQARVPIRRTQRLLEAYGGQVATLRLLARGISPELARPLQVDEVDLATSAKMASNALNMIPLFLLMAALMGGMHLAIDSTAGERERGSLEPLLLNPISRPALVAGKWLATILATTVTVLLTLLGFKIAIGRVPLEDLGVRADLGIEQMLSILAVVLPLTLMASAAQVLISTFARSFKEAQSYIQVLMMIPVLPSAFLSLSPIKTQLWMMAIPFLGQNLLVTSLMRGEGMDPMGLLLSLAGVLVVTGICLAATVRMLGSERVVFGR
ncbi:MAG: ABC transporter permease [Myxococcota bacterium]|nr:ABC transporter permease [Myxococcota bacterium]